jgi:2,4-dienoyl-CoA reductase-like NADH-dependent reductase (Old Yellow Enzyme family)
MTQPLLFTPIQLRSITLKNRIVVAPMHQYAAEKGFATDWHLMNAGKYAAGGAGFVMMESTKVARNGCGTVGDTGLWDDKFIPNLARCADFIRKQGAVPGIQLGHSGRKARLRRPWEGAAPLKGDEPEVYEWDDWELVAPSAVPHSEKSAVPRALSHNEVRDMVGKWADAAVRAEKCGFDILEIHAAHGYLLHQFLSPVTNLRTDEYGGSDVNRMRFPIEVAEAVRAVWPAEKPLFMRLSCEDDAGWDLDHSVKLSAELKRVGVDVIDCSSGGTLERLSPMDSARAKTYGYQVPYAERIRKETGVKTMAVGHIVHADQAEAILQSGRADLVADPDFTLVPPPLRYWLNKRAKSGFEGKPSTYAPGIGENHKHA